MAILSLTWNEFGLIPPVLGGGADSNRSPYVFSLELFINTFCTSVERYNILKGYISYRKRLHEVGIVSGMQWVNGSFTQNVEETEERAPNDIDIVSFIEYMSIERQKEIIDKDRTLFSNQIAIKTQYKVDGYIMPILGASINLDIIKKISYWYSMWSHRRGDDKWKGFIQVCLSEEETSKAASILEKKGAEYE